MGISFKHPPKPRIEVDMTVAERGKRDLWFLAKVILGKTYPDLVEHVHKPVCDFFVQKDPNVPFKRQDVIKERLLLDPRGHFKTSIDIVDTVQWILNFPDIRILLLSGTEKLVERMVMELKGHFMQNQDFRQIYPEFCPEDGATKWGDMGGFTVPNRTVNKREPTVSIATIDSQKAGSHYDVIKGDDIVNEINSQNRQQCQKVITQWNHITPLLDPGGYKDLIGTRYDWSDLYGEKIEKNTGRLKMFMRPAWVIQEGKKFLLFPERFCTDSELDPTKENLEQIQRDDPYIFSCQYLNDPLYAGSQSFPLELLAQHTVARQAIPSNLKIFITWDFAFSSKKTSDYTVGAVGGYAPDGTLYVLDILRGRWSPQQIIDMMIYGWRTWPVSREGFEEAAGSNLILPGLQATQRQVGLHFPVDLIPVSRQKDRTIQLVTSLEPLLRQNKLYFSSSIGCIQDLYQEFTKFPKYKNDDIAVAVGMLLHYRGLSAIQAPAYQQVEMGGSNYHPFLESEGENDERLSGGLVG